MAHEIFFEVNDGRGFVLTEYKESYGLIEAVKTNNGDVWKTWTFPVMKDKTPSEKMYPMKVNLGNHRTAVNTLKKVLQALTNDPDVQ